MKSKSLHVDTRPKSLNPLKYSDIRLEHLLKKIKSGFFFTSDSSPSRSLSKVRLKSTHVDTRPKNHTSFKWSTTFPNPKTAWVTLTCKTWRSDYPWIVDRWSRRSSTGLCKTTRCWGVLPGTKVVCWYQEWYPRMTVWTREKLPNLRWPCLSYCFEIILLCFALVVDRSDTLKYKLLTRKQSREVYSSNLTKFQGFFLENNLNVKSNFKQTLQLAGLIWIPEHIHKQSRINFFKSTFQI